MRGGHCLKVWCKKQQVIALSSAESELYAGLRTAAESLGMQSIGKDLGIDAPVELHMDSSAALSLVSRAGLGRAKHIEMQHLWLQDAVRKGRLSAHKVPSDDNPADLMTKPMGEQRIEYLMRTMSNHYVG